MRDEKFIEGGRSGQLARSALLNWHQVELQALLPCLLPPLAGVFEPGAYLTSQINGASRQTISKHDPREAHGKQPLACCVASYAPSEDSRTSLSTSQSWVDSAERQGLMDYIPLSAADQGPKRLWPAAQRMSQIDEKLRNPRLSAWFRWLSGHRLRGNTRSVLSFQHCKAGLRRCCQNGFLAVLLC